MSSFSNLNFTLNNTSGSTITGFKVARPSDNFTIAGYSGVGSSTTTDSELTVAGVSIGSGSSLGFSVSVGSNNIEAGSASWTVSASDGGGFINCSGSLDTAISGSPPDNSAPEISNATVSDIYATSAKINWMTNESTTGEVEYGTGSYDYTSSQSDANLSTAHSITLTALSANTTHYFIIRSRDASNNATETDESLFITAAADAGASTTIINVQTTTQTVTKTETKTETKTKIIEIRDTLPPVISISTDLNKSFEQAPEVEGLASDRSRIATVEYSVDGGENWLTVDEITSPGQASTKFRFIPSVFDDGNYEIQVRAIDGAGNKGTSKAQTLVIDRLPPLIGASLFTLGPLILQPNQKGEIITAAGVEQKVTISAAGGPTDINLIVGNTFYPLSRSVETGLWMGVIKFASSGVYQITYTAVDGGGNKSEGSLIRATVVESGQVADKKSGKPIPKAAVSLFQKDEQTGEWYPWDGTPFNQVSPQVTYQKGEYQYFLPPGTYYFKVEASGYEGVMSQIFSISRPTPVNSSFHLAKKNFPYQFKWDTVEVNLNVPETSFTEQIENKMVGKTTPDFNTLRGKSTLVTFLNSWSPPAIDQITILDSLYKKEGKRINFQAVAVQEKTAKVDVFAQRGGYEIPFIADQDGTLAQKFSAINLPTHVFLDRKGMVKKIISGVISGEEILSSF